MIDVSEIQEFLASLPLKVEQASEVAGFNLVASSVNRVHAQSKDSSGNPITSVQGTGYSTKPFFALTKDFVSRSGIPSTLISKSGKSVQLPEGYKSFRNFSGRQTQSIDLEYSGKTRLEYRHRVKDSGFIAGYISEESGNRMSYAEKRHGSSIIGPTPEEIDGIALDYAEIIFS